MLQIHFFQIRIFASVSNYWLYNHISTGWFSPASSLSLFSLELKPVGSAEEIANFLWWILWYKNSFTVSYYYCLLMTANGLSLLYCIINGVELSHCYFVSGIPPGWLGNVNLHDLHFFQWLAQIWHFHTCLFSGDVIMHTRLTHHHIT